MAEGTTIVSKVKAIMNEIGATGELASLLDEDTVKIDEYINSCIPDAVVLTIQNSKGRCVNPKTTTVTTGTPAGAATPTAVTLTANDDGTGYVVLPDDFISLIAFKMNGWKRIVSKAYDLDSEIYRQQSNPVTRAGKSKPVCILSRNSQGKRTLEYYSIGTGDTAQVSMFTYEARYNPTEGLTELKEGDALFGAVCYMCASLVYSIFENPATAAEMQKIAINLIDNGVPHQ